MSLLEFSSIIVDMMMVHLGLVKVMQFVTGLDKNQVSGLWTYFFLHFKLGIRDSP